MIRWDGNQDECILHSPWDQTPLMIDSPTTAIARRITVLYPEGQMTKDFVYSSLYSISSSETEELGLYDFILTFLSESLITLLPQRRELSLSPYL